ncbi:hypothetical protein [Raoultella ornithinolytica]|uniref:hypothetical protein n=1 Tax=Raoultella ornithinolytica TaxID=54291 RepID=UPI00096A3170
MNNDGLTLNQLAERNAVLVSEVEKLRAERDQLAAENVGLKAAAEFATAPDMWIEQADGMLDYRYCDWYVDVLKAAMETPATDRIVAGIKADGVEEFAAKLESRGRHQDYVEIANAFAKQLREGADK